MPRQVIESLKCFEQGVLKSVSSRLSIGAPEWTGGFLQLVNTYEYNGPLGLAVIYGERFSVLPL